MQLSHHSDFPGLSDCVSEYSSLSKSTHGCHICRQGGSLTTHLICTLTGEILALPALFIAKLIGSKEILKVVPYA